MIAYSEYVSDARIRREAESLSQRGDHVDLICLSSERRTTPRTLNGVRIYPLKVKRYRGSSNWRYGLSYVTFFCGALLFVTWRHLRYRYNLIQVHTMPDFMVFAALFPRLTGAGVILDVHDLMPELYMSKFNLARNHSLIRAIVYIERASIAFAHKAIAVHRTHLEALIAHGNSPERFEVLLNTPDPAVFVRGHSHRSSGNFKLVYHGTISHRHGLEMALQAVAIARRWIPHLRFSIIGDGDDVDRLIRLASELGIDGCIEFNRRFVPVNDLPGLLMDADLGVIPLRKDKFTEYMLPVKLMEYVALGIPSIVTRTSTIKQYFDDNMVEYINGESDEELARAIIELYNNPKQRAEMVLCAAEFTKHHNWDTQKLLYYSLIDSLVGRQSRLRYRIGSLSLVGRSDKRKRSHTECSAASGGM